MQNDAYSIYKITSINAEALLKIAKNTFVAFFKEFNSEKNLNDYVNKAFTINKIVAEIENPNSAFYFAQYKNQNIGYLKVNFGSAQTELQDHTSLEIERIYVLNEFTGKKVGQLLVNKAIEIAKSKKLKYIWLGVWEQNFRAIRFYEKQNFIKFDTHVFKMGNEDQIDYLMKLIV